MSLEHKARAVLGRAVVYGHAAKALALQGNRVIALFTSSDRHIEVPELNAEFYQFLLCANQLTQFLSENSRPKKQFVSAEDLENTNFLEIFGNTVIQAKHDLTPDGSHTMRLNGTGSTVIFLAHGLK